MRGLDEWMEAAMDQLQEIQPKGGELQKLCSGGTETNMSAMRRLSLRAAATRAHSRLEGRPAIMLGRR